MTQGRRKFRNPTEPRDSPASGRYSLPMPEAKPDPSGSTGEFRAFFENGGADPMPRRVLSNRVIIVAMVALLAVIVVIALAVR